MNLLIVNTSTGWGGLELNVVKLANELAKNKLDIHFVTRADSPSDKAIQGQFLHQLRLKKVKKYFDFKNAKLLAKYIEEHQITHVFTAFRPDLDLLMWTKRRVKGLKIIYQQQMQMGISKKGIFHKMRYDAVNLWLTPLEWLKEEALEKSPIDEHKIRIVPLGVRREPFLVEQPSRDEAQKFFSFSSNAFVIGVIGRIDEKKGQLFLAQAIKELREQGENVELLIVGMPTVDDNRSVIYHQQILDYLKANDLEQVVHFAPFTKEVNKFYQAIDLFVMSSEGETFGMVTVEAMFAKTAVIGTNSSGTPEVLGHGSRGGLYSFGNLPSFITAYKELRKKIDQGELDRSVIQQRAMELYSLDKEVDGVLDALKELN